MKGGPGFVLFHDGTRLDYDQPKNTLDPRYPACVEHRVACDCREAEYAEEGTEFRADWASLLAAVKEICAGHPRECMCTGCQIARRIHVSYVIPRSLPRV